MITWFMRRKGIDTGQPARLDDEAELLVHFARRRRLRNLGGIKEAGDEAVPALGPAMAAHQDDMAAPLDDRRRHWHRREIGDPATGIGGAEALAGLARDRRQHTAAKAAMTRRFIGHGRAYDGRRAAGKADCRRNNSVGYSAGHAC